jgi:hypothetical protein
MRKFYIVSGEKTFMHWSLWIAFNMETDVFNWTVVIIIFVSDI